MNSKFLSPLALLTILLFCPTAFAGEQEVLTALSARDSLSPVGLNELEELAGSKEELIEILLKYRRSETPPFVGIRSERILLNYAENKEVMEALESDVNDAKYFGLARTIGTHIDSVKDSSSRARLATAVLKRAQTEKRFNMFGRILLESKDSEVKRLAREANLK